MAPAPRSSRWWIVPAVLVGLVVVAWLVLSGLPFRREAPAPRAPKYDTVAEQESVPPPQTTAPSATIVELDADEEQPEAPVTTPAPQPRPQPPPERAPEARTTPTPTPAPRPPQPPAAAEITAADAEATLRNFVASNNYYRIGSDCVRVSNRGYRNVGYDLEVWDTCAAGGGSRLLGRWRVDSKTREVFRQREDGRYLRP